MSTPKKLIQSCSPPTWFNKTTCGLYNKSLVWSWKEDTEERGSVWIIRYHEVEWNCTCILEILRYFFIMQSLATLEMRKFQTLKLSHFHKEKTCWTENWWSSGIMSNFWGEFFYVLLSSPTDIGRPNSLHAIKIL